LVPDVADHLAGHFIGGLQLLLGPLCHAELDLVDVLGQQHVAQLQRAGDPQTAGQVPIQRQLQVDPLVASLMSLFRRSG